MNLESELFAFPVSVRVRRLFSVVQVKLKNLSRAPAVAAEQNVSGYRRGFVAKWRRGSALEP